MLKLLLLCILFCVCWPLGLFVLVLYPLLWLLLLPFRLVGLVVEGVFGLLTALFLLPVRLVRAI